MKIGRIIPYGRHITSIRPRLNSPFGKLDTGKGAYYTGTDLYGDLVYCFNEVLIPLYDRALVTGNKYVLSLEQQKLLEKYLTEADTITPPDSIPIEDWVYDFASLSEIIQQLDVFLGSYIVQVPYPSCMENENG